MSEIETGDVVPGLVASPPAEIHKMVEELLDTTGISRNRDLLREIILASLGFATANASRLDLKIARSAIAEMAAAFRVFAPYRDMPKVTMFGSARTAPSDPLYALARELAEQLSTAGYMVVTGAGPGIMAAGSEGAGRAMTLGVNIKLPFETAANVYIDPEDKLVEMKYFFTRKLMLMKESIGYLVLPGGFGTLDECFELLTLIQTGKAEPAPVVLIDIPGHHYWHHWEQFLDEEVYARGFADTIDSALYCIAETPKGAIDELLGFHRNYQSRRFVGRTMVIRLIHAPDDETLARLSREYADICSAKGIWRTEPLAAERQGNDELGYERIALEYSRAHQNRLRQLINDLNAIPF